MGGVINTVAGDVVVGYGVTAAQALAQGTHHFSTTGIDWSKS